MPAYGAETCPHSLPHFLQCHLGLFVEIMQPPSLISPACARANIFGPGKP